MRLHFLKASVPLTKAFTRQADGTLDRSAYPLTKHVTSETEEANNLTDFYAALTTHALAGHCLLKGELDRELCNESRAGHTNPLAPTRWIVFDLDGLDFPNTESFVTESLPSEFQEASYIVQHSASSGIYGTGLRQHLFFLLAEPVSPVLLKGWLTHLNFTVPSLAAGLRLSKNGMTLAYGLDRTVAQNDKLIYIAPPICEGFEDPIAAQRIQLVQKARDTVRYNFPFVTEATLQNLAEDKIKALRQAAGLKAARPKMAFVDTISEWVLTNPERAQVTDVREQNGFIRLNINGGDSWGYYFSPHNPKYLRNFKGEPTVLLKDFAPEFWDQWQKQMRADQREQTLVFRHPATDTWWTGVYDPLLDRLEGMYPIKSRDRIEDFCANRNVPVPDPIPDWTYEFCPQDDTVCSINRKFANRWQPTEYMRSAAASTELPPIIAKILWSVVGNDRQAFDHFLNWLAYIFQTRQKTQTAWVLHGLPGTGKGLLFNSILRPIFGPAYCVTKELHNLDDKFNDYMETTLLVNIDEARVDNARDMTKTINQLKHAITEPVLSVRGMFQAPRQVPNYTNFIFTSNDYDAMRIDQADRRFNVAPRQEQKLLISPEEIGVIHTELSGFAGYLKGYTVDVNRVKQVLNNNAKAAMREHSMDAIEQFCHAVLTGDFAFFITLFEYGAGHSMDAIAAWQQFGEVMCHWRSFVNTGTPCPVRRKELLSIYHYAFDNKIKPQKFNRMLAHKNVPEPSPATYGGVILRAIPVTWRCSPETLETWDNGRVKKEGNVVPFQRKAAPGEGR